MKTMKKYDGERRAGSTKFCEKQPSLIYNHDWAQNLICENTEFKNCSAQKMSDHKYI